MSVTSLARTSPDAVDEAFFAALTSTAVPGAVAMAADRSGIIYHGAFGNADMGRVMRENDLFRIASMTKAITSTAAMQLIEQGRLTLEDKVRDFLPDFAVLPLFEHFDAVSGNYLLRPAVEIVTVRHLLTHTSGLVNNFTSPLIRDFKPHAGEHYPIGPLLFEPGQQWHYGTSTDQLGYLIEAVAGQPLDYYLRRNIFEPLGITDTFYEIPAAQKPRLVPAHHRRQDGVIVKTPPTPPVARPRGGSGLVSTAADYLRFTRMILGAGALEGARILKPETVAMMAANQIGPLGVPVMRTAMPERSADFTFVNDGRDKFGLGFLITGETVQGKRAAGSLSWGGINNTYYWIDRDRGITGVLLMQFLPFADPEALTLYDVFERAIYAMTAD